MVKRTDPLYQPSLLQYVICYAVWVALAVISVFLILQVRVNLLQSIALFLIPDPRVMRVIDNASIFGLGVIILIAILVMEHWFRTGLAKRVFWSRVARAIVIIAIVFGLSYGINIVSKALVIR